MILTVFCSFCSQGSAKSFVSPQLPYSGRRWTGDPAVSSGREPHRLVKRGKKRGVLLPATPEGRGGVSIISLFCLETLECDWGLSPQNLLQIKAYQSSTEPLLWFMSSAQLWRKQNAVLKWNHDMMWTLLIATMWFGVFAQFTTFTLILLVCDGLLLLYQRNKLGARFYSRSLWQQVGSLSFFLASKHSEEASYLFWRLWAASFQFGKAYQS